MEHFRWQLTISVDGHIVALSQNGMFMKALGSIWEISDQESKICFLGKLRRHFCSCCFL